MVDTTEREIRVNTEYEDHLCSKEQRSLGMVAAAGIIGKVGDGDPTQDRSW